jgi:CDP-paratose 2-epimerase
VTSSLVDPRHDFDVNAGGTMNVLEAMRELDDRPPLCSPPRTRSTARSTTSRCECRWRWYEPLDPELRAAASPRRARSRLPLALRLLEGRRRPVRARLRAHLRAAGGAAHELHLRAAAVRHRGPGLGRAFPDPGARDERPITIYGDGRRCATSSTSTISSTRWSRRTSTDRSPRGARRSTSAAGPRTPSASLELLDLIERSSAPSPSRPGAVASGRPAVLRLGHAFTLATGWRPHVRR